MQHRFYTMKKHKAQDEQASDLKDTTIKTYVDKPIHVLKILQFLIRKTFILPVTGIHHVEQHS